LPVGSETGDLEDHQSVVGKELVDLSEERAVSSDTDVLGHLETGDLVVVALLVGDLSVVLAEDSALGLGDTVGSETFSTKGGLVSGKGDCE
jgi:hypothetical protein